MNTCKHPDKPTVARCVACGMVLCYECRVWNKGRNFCADCAPGNPAGYRSPNFSMFLSLVPGLGQIYAGSFFKGLVVLAAAAGCGAFHWQLPALVPLFVWVYAIWDARITAQKRNFRVTKGRSGSSGPSEGDWMLILGAGGLAGLYVGLPLFAGVSMAPWTLWASFLVIFVLSALLGRGGKDVKST